LVTLSDVAAARALADGCCGVTVVGEGEGGEIAFAAGATEAPFVFVFEGDDPIDAAPPPTILPIL
jgi:hypothetical protein